MAFLLEKMVLLTLFRWQHRRALWPISRCKKHKFNTDCPNWSWRIWSKRLLSRFQIDNRVKSSDFNNLHLFRYFWRQFECWSKTLTLSPTEKKQTFGLSPLLTTPMLALIHSPSILKCQDHGRFQTFKRMTWEVEWKYMRKNCKI